MSGENGRSITVAVALQYEHDSGAAPRVVAKGKGAVAERIVEQAREAGVAVETNEALARSLAELEMDRAIPAELYRAVAEVIGFLMRKGYQIKGRS